MFQKLSLRFKILLGKIFIKALLIPGFKKWFGRVVQLSDGVQNKKESDVFNRKEVCLNFSHYLPDTEARIERLRRVINKRPVAIILHGPSLKELESRITELEDCDICYFSLNTFRPAEKHILARINRNFSVVMVSAILAGAYGNTTDVNDFIEFLERPEDNIFISERDSFRPVEAQGFAFGEFVKKYDKKLLFFTATPTTSVTVGEGLFIRVPSIEYPLHFLAQSSFSILLSMALIGEASMVVVFGGDGGRIEGEELHFRETSGGVPDAVVEPDLVKDTRMFNMTMPIMLDKIYKMYNLKPVDIINCSLQSHYTPLRKLSYDETFTQLKSYRKLAV